MKITAHKIPSVFIIGCPRSGTTLLSSLLEYTKYGAPVETHFITKYYKKLNKYQPLSEMKNFKKLVKDIASERPIQQWKLNFNISYLWDKFKENNTFSYSELVNLICMERFAKLGKQGWGDKTPHYIIDIDILYSLFPNSKYIHIVRDGRDVALSLLRKKWGPNNVYACAKLWKKCNENSKVIKQMKENGSLFEIKYEDLLQFPKEIITNIYDFLEEELPKEYVEKFCKKIKKDNFYKWRKQMSQKEVLVFEAVAKDILNKFNYPVINPSARVNSLEQIYYEIHETIKKFIYLFELNVIDGFKIKFLGKEPFAE